MTALGRVEVLHRAEGIQLLGELGGSGYREPPALVRRADGQTVQLSALLYLVLEAIDGERDVEQVAAAVSAAYGRRVSAENIGSLVDAKLRPLGLLARADGSQPEVRRSNPLLALRFRYAVTDPDRTRRLTGPFARLFHPAVVVPVVAAFLVVCWWVFFEKGLASATAQAFDEPGLLLLVVAVTVLSAGFHEFGHAAAARYGGATPGVMGAGIYLVWPAFYTDVTDSYRLGRGGRLRTDLGGLYFNAIVAVAITAVWWGSRYDALLLVVATQILQMLRQLTPLVRFDGYHVLADLTGVPDLFHRIGPTLLGLLPWRWGDPEGKVLKPWARAVVTLWVLVVVPVLLSTVAIMVLALPRVLGTAWAKLQRDNQLLAVAWDHGQTSASAARLVAMAAVVLPILAGFVVLARVLRRLVVSAWRRTDGHPARRTTAGVLALALVAGLAWVWWPGGGTYRPIQPSERGTLLDAVSAARPAPTLLRDGARGTVRAVWDTSDPVPTAEHPRLALVLLPRDGTAPAGDADAPDGQEGAAPRAWVFPFDKPLAPGPGDNQALAVNTTDGTAVYDVAFALVWVEDGEAALSTNEAYAFASCDSCAAVAVGFQIVLVVGDNHVSAPRNLAGALNYDCANCLTYALAKQLFVTVPGPLGAPARAELDALWQRIAAFGARIEAGDVPLAQVQATLEDYQRQILDLVERDQPGTVPSPAPSSTATATAPSGGPSPTAGTTDETTPGPTTGPTTSASAGPTPTPTPTPSPDLSTSPGQTAGSEPLVGGSTSPGSP